MSFFKKMAAIPALFLALCFGSAAWSAISLDSVTTTAFSNMGNGLSYSHTTGSGSNVVMLVSVGSSSGSPNDANSVTFDGNPLSLVAKKVQPLSIGAYEIAEIWALINPPASTTGNVVVSFPLSSGIGSGAGAWSGVDLNNPFGSVSLDGVNASNTLNSFFNSSTAGSLLFSVVTDPFGLAFPGGFDSQLDLIWDTPGTQLSNLGTMAAPTTGPYSVTNTSGGSLGFAQVLLELRPADAADTVTPSPSPTEVQSPTETPTPSITDTFTISPTFTDSPTASATPTSTETPVNEGAIVQPNYLFQFENSVRDSITCLQPTQTGSIAFTQSPAPPAGSTGGFYSIQFGNGVERIGSAAIASALNGARYVALEAWVQPDNTSYNQGQRIFSFGGAGNGVVMRQGSGSIQAVDVGGGWQTVNSNQVLIQDQWNHLVYVFDSTDPNNSHSDIYINGVLDQTSSGTCGSGGLSCPFVCSNFTIGNREDGSRPFLGKIKDAAVYIGNPIVAPFYPFVFSLGTCQPTHTVTPSVTPSFTISPTQTMTQTPSADTDTETQTFTDTPTDTDTFTDTDTPTDTETPTITPTSTPAGPGTDLQPNHLFPFEKNAKDSITCAALTTVGNVTYAKNQPPVLNTSGGLYSVNLGDDGEWLSSPQIAAELNGADYVAIGFWVYPTNTNYNFGQRMISFGGPANAIVMSRNSGDIQAVIHGGTWAQVNSSRELPDEAWSHVFMIFDSTDPDNATLNLFFNNENVGSSSGTCGQTGQPCAFTCSDFTIGNREDGSRPFFGNMKDVEIYIGRSVVSPFYPYAFNLGPCRPAPIGGGGSGRTSPFLFPFW